MRMVILGEGRRVETIILLNSVYEMNAFTSIQKKINI